MESLNCRFNHDLPRWTVEILIREDPVLFAHAQEMSQGLQFLTLVSGSSHQARDAFLLQGSAFVVCLDSAGDAKIGTLPKCGPHAVVPRRNDHRR